MTKYEKISTAISIIALLLSIAAPIFIYYWLDPTLQSFKLRARLQTVAVPSVVRGYTDGSSAYVTFGPPGLDGKDYKIEILNIGQLPARDMQVIAEYDDSYQDEPSFTIDPPALIESKISNNKMYITVKRPLAPQDKMRITFAVSPVTIWILNEFGETDTIHTGARITGNNSISGSKNKETKQHSR